MQIIDVHQPTIDFSAERRDAAIEDKFDELRTDAHEIRKCWEPILAPPLAVCMLLVNYPPNAYPAMSARPIVDRLYMHLRALLGDTELRFDADIDNCFDGYIRCTDDLSLALARWPDDTSDTEVMRIAGMLSDCVSAALYMRATEMVGIDTDHDGK